MKRIALIIHNIAWSHYKAVVFSELYKILKANDIDMFVLQIALTEKGRHGIGEFDKSIHNYAYKILFESSFEETTVKDRTIRIMKEIVNFKPDVVVLPGYNDLSYWVGLLLSNFSNCKVIVCVDSNYFDKPRRWYKELLKKLFVKFCDVGFCYGTKSMEYLMRLGMERENILVRCQATDFETIQRIHDEAKTDREKTIRALGLKPYNFIYVGRLSREKNIDFLIEAFHDLKNDCANAFEWGLLIVGDGDEKARLKRMVEELKIDDVFFFSGKSWKEVPAYYALSDLLVLPSISEPWGLVVNEAMICRLPVIVSNRCGSAYDLVIEGENGFTFDPFDRKDLAGKMAKFVNNEVDREEMGKASRQIIEDYRPERAAEQMLKGIIRCNCFTV